MFIANNESVLVNFKTLCERWPRENVIALWEMAGGTTTHAVDGAKTAATLSGLYNCSVCGQEKCTEPGICDDCLAINNATGCGKHKISSTVKGLPEPVEVTFRDGTVKFYNSWEDVNKMNINTNYTFLINDEPLPIGITYLHSNGDIHFQGNAPIIQRVMKAGVEFKVRAKNDNLVLAAEILKIGAITVFDPVAVTSDNASSIRVVVETICRINYCEFFVPL